MMKLRLILSEHRERGDASAEVTTGKENVQIIPLYSLS